MPDKYPHYFFRILGPDTSGMAKMIMAKYLVRESWRVFFKKQTLVQRFRELNDEITVIL